MWKLSRPSTSTFPYVTKLPFCYHKPFYFDETPTNSFTAIAGAYQGGNGGDAGDGAVGTPSKKGTPRKRASKKKAAAGDDDDEEISDFGSAKKGMLNKVKGGRVTKARGGGKGNIKQSDSDNEGEELGSL